MLFRSAAFKLLQLDDQFRFLKRGARVVDLGAAPGGWIQVAVERTRPEETKGVVIGIDITPVEPISGATVLAKDFYDDDAPALLTNLLGGPADVVLSDMAASATGDTQVDHLRIMGLAEAAAQFASEVLAPGGAFLCKVFQGGTERELLDMLKRDFATVRHVKPHGALYNEAADDAAVADIIIDAVRDIDSRLAVMALAGSVLAEQIGRAHV